MIQPFGFDQSQIIAVSGLGGGPFGTMSLGLGPA